MFAKAAEDGRVKTRLVPPLSARQAADLARAFLCDTFATIERVALTIDADAFVFFSPREAEPWFRALLGASAKLQPQSDGNLTVRLQQAYATLERLTYANVCFVGADSPTMPEPYLATAFEALRTEDDVVIGPACDGGYYLLGLAARHFELFQDIAWSTDRVFAQTCATVERLGLRLTLLPEWYDVDDGASLERLQHELTPPPDEAGLSTVLAPHTRACLSRMAGVLEAPRDGTT